MKEQQDIYSSEIFPSFVNTVNFLHFVNKLLVLLPQMNKNPIDDFSYLHTEFFPRISYIDVVFLTYLAKYLFS